MIHVLHHGSHQQMQLGDFYGEQFPLDYRVMLLNLPIIDLFGSNQLGSLGHKRIRNIYGDLHHLDREVS
ncbi:hypothetical protein [Citrobacter portucalensis]|uniref:hypothetical protein n=1 Tax=Citrobacter portucalensis TaxID=1639133 RepID=UPI0039FD5FAB